MIEYTSENGYSGKLYGKSSMSIFDKDGKEVMHTGFRTPNTQEELKEVVDRFPTFIEALKRVTVDDFEDGEEE